MKILSGIFKKKKIFFKKNKFIRPITNIIKKKIFNKLIIKKKFLVLDLFSGSGSISYEFLSNYCKVFSVDIFHQSIYFLKKNKKKFNIFNNINIFKMDVIKFLKKKNKKKFNIIFIDPPYSYNINKINIILKLIIQKKIKKNGIIILSNLLKNKFFFILNFFYFIINKNNCIFFFKKN
ncbi:MAG: RsmD family RNA methyltransferase [Candidatus Shikimatogenerans sp. Ttur]|uniref:RsmD family RNA methyltransferase n=1 Tax=Candidatus Shikimatogenerans sp. Ttur TaxID=3158569 RepID=A0AAU7ZXW1_9FLAO